MGSLMCVMEMDEGKRSLPDRGAAGGAVDERKKKHGGGRLVGAANCPIVADVVNFARHPVGFAERRCHAAFSS